MKDVTLNQIPVVGEWGRRKQGTFIITITHSRTPIGNNPKKVGTKGSI